MSVKADKILFWVGILSLIVLLPIEIFLKYDTTTRQLALTLTNVETLVILLILYFYFKIKHHFVLSFIVSWAVSLGVWFDAAGNFANLYHDLIWWDDLSHVVGTAAVALALFLIIFELNKQEKIKIGLFGTILFSLSLSVFGSALYEISEFLGDLMSESQRVVDKFDTPSDLTWNTLGALFIILLSALIVSWQKRRKT